MAALVTPFAVLFTRKPRPLGPRPLPGGVPKAGLGQSATPAASSIWPLITGMVIAIAVVVALTLLSRRKRPARTWPGSRTRLATLLDSLAAGSDALTAGGEPRAAIIACYAAMERGFAAAGSAPAVADTPAEVLARATRAGPGQARACRDADRPVPPGQVQHAPDDQRRLPGCRGRPHRDARRPRSARRPARGPDREPPPGPGRAATVTGTAAALVAGYAAAGATGLIDVAAVATLGVLIVARGMLRGEKPRLRSA